MGNQRRSGLRNVPAMNLGQVLRPRPAAVEKFSVRREIHLAKKDLVIHLPWQHCATNDGTIEQSKPKQSG